MSEERPSLKSKTPLETVLNLIREQPNVSREFKAALPKGESEV